MALWLKVHCQAYNSLVTTFYITLWIWLGTVIQYSYIDLQVAALAPLALLLVLEARCAHFVIAHFNNFFVL